MKVLYLDNDQDCDVDIRDAAADLGLDFVFYGLGKGIYKSVNWKGLKPLGPVLRVDSDEEQARHLAAIIEKEKPTLIWIRSLSVNASVVYAEADKRGIDVLFWVTEWGATRDASFEVAKGYRKLIINNPDDVTYYRERTGAKLYLMPQGVNPSFYSRRPASPAYAADLMSMGNPIYSKFAPTAERVVPIDKWVSVDWMVRPAVEAGMNVKVFGYGGGEGIEKGWLQVPYLNKNPLNGLIDKATDASFPGAYRLKKAYFKSPLARLGSRYQGAFPWEDLPTVLSSCTFFANIDHGYKNHRTYSAKGVKAMACGAVVLHMPTPGIEHDFKDMEHLVVVHSEDECREKLKFLTNNPAQIERIRKNAMELAHTEWSYRHKLPALLKAVAQN